MLTIKNVTIAFVAIALSFLAGCSDTNDTMSDSPELLEDEPLKQQETEQDTTLQPIQEITIRAFGDDAETMAYDQDTLVVKAGALIRISLINEGSDPTMIHNIVFTQPDKYKVVALAGAEAGASGNYVPDSPAIIAASPIVLPGQTVMLEFKAPVKPGSYDFVCTYPDHYQRMNGKMIVK